MNAFERIYTVVSTIPKGKVSTYQHIAKIAGIASPRFVGFALHQNKHPNRIPCHRVVKSTGLIANGYAFGGPKAQEEKLKEEGVPFLSNKRVDLAKGLAKVLPYRFPREGSSVLKTHIDL